jgi:hypothetical protein
MASTLLQVSSPLWPGSATRSLLKVRARDGDTNLGPVMQVQIQNIEGNLGPQEAGVLVAIFLFGMVTLQAFTYYQKYSHDAAGVKALVRIICCSLL